MSKIPTARAARLQGFANELTKEASGTKPDTAVSTTQTNIGKEQSAEAAKLTGGKTPTNTDGKTSNTQQIAGGNVKENTEPGINAPVRKEDANRMQEKSASARIARANLLGDTINNVIHQKVASAQAQTSLEKEASFRKEASAAYAEDLAYWHNLGMQKSASDVADLQSSMPPEQLAALGGAPDVLASAAQSNPEAVLPEEAMEGEGGGGGEEGDLIAKLKAAGMTDEQIAADTQAVKDLLDAGISPEEIMQATEANAQLESGAPAEKVAAAYSARVHVVHDHLFGDR